MVCESQVHEHILFPIIRWSCVTGHAPHAAPGLGAGRSQSSSPCPPAARLLVPRCPAHTLLLPALPSDGVHGESQPGATQNGLEQREVGLPLQAALINTWWPYSYAWSGRNHIAPEEVVMIQWSCEDLLNSPLCAFVVGLHLITSLVGFSLRWFVLTLG